MDNTDATLKENLISKEERRIKKDRTQRVLLLLNALEILCVLLPLIKAIIIQHESGYALPCLNGTNNTCLP